MKNQAYASTRPNLKTRGFSSLHIDIFKYILLGKTNREINSKLGYTRRSHAVVDHSRKVMQKLLAMENLCKRDYADRMIKPRSYIFWWKALFDKHTEKLYAIAIAPQFYDEASESWLG